MRTERATKKPQREPTDDPDRSRDGAPAQPEAGVNASVPWIQTGHPVGTGMSAPNPPVPARRLSPELVAALAEILADALVADLVQYPQPPGDEAATPPGERPGVPRSPRSPSPGG